MVGSYRVSVKNSRNSYSFMINRNITILCGDSGKGKTTLYEMIAEYGRFGMSSGVSVSCDRPLIALDGADWEEKLSRISSSIIVVDEDSRFIHSKDFAGYVKKGENYFLLITREYLPQLPYSVDEIYSVEGRKNKHFVRIFHDIEKMYDRPQEKYIPFRPDVIITEDERSGYHFFRTVSQTEGINCVSAGGKSRIYDFLKEYEKENVLVIADGAAFGAEISEIVKKQRLRPRKLGIFLPESFEWLILSSGVADLREDDERLLMPENYADSTKYESWEQYFTKLLTEITKESRFKSYKKEKLKPFYTQEDTAAKIMDKCKGIRLRTEGVTYHGLL
ncbi:MAG: ATP-binding protein [Lachnospiraceae bacterium]|nr:ATP-binding protein [Lachnospiraceae bacterium]